MKYFIAYLLAVALVFIVSLFTGVNLVEAYVFAAEETGGYIVPSTLALIIPIVYGGILITPFALLWAGCCLLHWVCMGCPKTDSKAEELIRYFQEEAPAKIEEIDRLQWKIEVMELQLQHAKTKRKIIELVHRKDIALSKIYALMYERIV